MSEAPLNERGETIRETIRRVLSDGPATAKDLSAEAHIPEKDVADHLEHLAKSLKNEDARLKIDPAECLACGYEFKDRKRFTKPGACPKCRSTRIDPPQFEIVTE
ncbi:MAG: transcriptional regulator [Myxococcaceae bacterium]